MSSNTNRVGVCSWSLQPKSAAHLVQLVRGVGVESVQLALDPIRRKKWKLEETREALRGAGIVACSGMMAMEGEDYTTLESIRRTGGVSPDGTWEANCLAARVNARIARELGIPLVTFHAGHMPDRKQKRARAVFVDRVHRIARAFGEQGVRVALETGQETWQSVLGLLADLDRLDRAMGLDLRVGVNFDPANMILYGMGDPIEAMRELLPRVVQVHVKDARATGKAGTWGTEVPAGDGDVLWRAFFELIELAERPIGMMIEREGGSARVEDARAARGMIERLWESGRGQSDGVSGVEVLAPQPRTIGVGVVGLGFMGRTHVGAYRSLAGRRAVEGGAAPCVVAACDVRDDARAGKAGASGNIDTGGSGLELKDVALYESAAELFADPSVEAVSICTPTHTHKKLVWAALAAGKHVLVEKPAVLDPRDARELAEASAGAGRVVMPAMCMRFWPGWPWLKEAIDSKRYGKLKSLVFQRLGTRPGWSSVYGDDSKTGGAIADLHVHDADLVLWMLGAPSAVASVGTASHVSTQYYFDKRPGVLVTAEGSWDHAPGWPFAMRYCATFERATADMDSSRGEPLMVYRDGVGEAVELRGGTGYDVEIEHFTDLVVAAMDGKKVKPTVTLWDAERVAALLEVESASQRARRIAEFEDVEAPFVLLRGRGRAAGKAGRGSRRKNGGKGRGRTKRSRR